MSNLRARDALERARQGFLDHPSAGRKPNAPATAVWRSGLQCEIAGPNGETARTDMPGPMGGDGSGPNPGWLLRASMASCAATVIAMQAARLGIELSALEVAVHSESDARGMLGIEGASTAMDAIRMSIRIAADNVPEDQLRALAQWGEAASPVSCTLRAQSAVAVEIMTAAPGAAAPSS